MDDISTSIISTLSFSLGSSDSSVRGFLLRLLNDVVSTSSSSSASTYDTRCRLRSPRSLSRSTLSSSNSLPFSSSSSSSSSSISSSDSELSLSLYLLRRFIRSARDNRVVSCAYPAGGLREPHTIQERALSSFIVEHDTHFQSGRTGLSRSLLPPLKDSSSLSSYCPRILALRDSLARTLAARLGRVASVPKESSGRSPATKLRFAAMLFRLFLGGAIPCPDTVVALLPSPALRTPRGTFCTRSYAKHRSKQ
mmetsp:Transcript_23256/g.34137  ORF Transcript_23256/g.34137 Transcript_23256/m.34137 type:complete len:252 (-) Transcript_23256:3810-4565(-)